jgi:hypothetical protein
VGRVVEYEKQKQMVNRYYERYKTLPADFKDRQETEMKRMKEKWARWGVDWKKVYLEEPSLPLPTKQGTSFISIVKNLFFLSLAAYLFLVLLRKKIVPRLIETNPRMRNKRV